MAIHTPINKSGIYFITFTCYKWISLIEQTNTYEEVYKFFEILNKDHSVLGYVIMPNHLHLLLHYNKNKQSLNTIIGNGKRFIGYEMIKRLQVQTEETMLAILAQGVPAIERKRNKLHQLWQGTFDVKECRTEKFILQKLNYMHQNPCTERWRLASRPCEYIHSSSAFYDLGKEGKIKVKDYRDLMAILLEEEEKVMIDPMSPR